MGVPDIEKIRPKGLGVRHAQTFLLFLAMILAFCMRVNMSMAIVDMTNEENDTTYLTKRPEATVQKPIRVIKQGNEPTDFHIVFAKWDPDMWLKQNIYETEREAVLRNNEIRDAK